MTNPFTIHQGDALEVLRGMDAESVQCCVTSPPYWGLRDYGVEGQLGLEATPEEYVEKIVAVFAEVRRVLRKDGTLWLNMGDCYVGGGRGGIGDKSTLQGSGDNQNESRKARKSFRRDSRPCGDRPHKAAPGLGPKNLVGQPWRVAFALQADGWWLRQDIIWAKPNPMPESVTDRCTKAHEYLFLLTKAARYYWDADAIREAQTTQDQGFCGRTPPPNKGNLDGFQERAAALTKGGWIPNAGYNPAGRNRRSVWSIPSQPYPEAHFATFPEALVEPCVLAGTPGYGCCPDCGAPYRCFASMKFPDAGWEPTCGCYPPDIERKRWEKLPSDEHRRYWTERVWKTPPPREPCVVLDPFAGSGTTLAVAVRLGRYARGIELNPEYIELARKRIEPHAAQGRLF